MSRNFDDVMLGSIELFCLTAEAESFTAAATAAGLTPAAVSRAISRLETRLGVQLFVRTTRRVRLTEGGHNYYAQCRQALTQLLDAEREITGKQHAPSGTVRISLPTSYGHHRVLPLLPEFIALYPGVELDIHVSNRNIDFTAESFDLAVRGRVQADSGLVAHPLEVSQLILVASPDYLQRRGTPTSIESLGDHTCIQFVLPRTGQLNPWTLRSGSKDISISPKATIRCSEDILGVITLTKHGAGVCQTYRFIVEEELKNGTLIEVLPECSSPSPPFSLIFPARRHLPRRVRVLIDFLLQRLLPP